jgi:hypothetical protein
LIFSACEVALLTTLPVFFAVRSANCWKALFSESVLTTT